MTQYKFTWAWVVTTRSDDIRKIHMAFSPPSIMVFNNEWDPEPEVLGSLHRGLILAHYPAMYPIVSNLQRFS
jgi:hypothetical protein